MGDQPQPSTPPSTRQQRDHRSTDATFRNVRRRIDYGLEPTPPMPDSTSIATVFEFHVYLPNRSSVEVRVAGVEKCRALTVSVFVRLVREELGKCGEQAVSKQKQRGIAWGDHVYFEDFSGNPVAGVGAFALGHESKAARVLLLFDGHPDTVHAHVDFWNVTPEPQMLGVLPQDYTIFSALADEMDNSLQAVFQLESGKQRLICVNLEHKEGTISIFDTGKGMDSTPHNCISKWGTIGSSMNRHSVVEAIGGKPPYLKPNFGMYGFGGIGAGLHLGGVIRVSSKTEVSRRVAILHLGREALTTSVKTGSVWKTGGEFRAPTQQELEWSPHGSFTKVEISALNWRVGSWKVEEVQRKLKDYYFPYIQNDEGEGGMTDTPVEIRVNGENLAGIVGGEVTHSNFHSSRGEPYVIILEFTKPKETNASGDGVDRANARITCHYFPIINGKEAIDDIIEAIKQEDSEFSEDFESFSRRSIRRLGRLLPDAGRVLPEDRSAGRLPFMEPKRYFRENEVNKHCYKRVKAFIDVDAGFIPTTSKMDLVQKHPFTKALLELGLGLQTEDTAKKTLKKGTGPVTVSITRISEESGNFPIRPQDLHANYTAWITQNHESFDVGAIINDGVIIATKEHHKQELNISKDVFRVVFDITCKNIDWKVGKDHAPVHLKLLKGLPGLRNDDKDMFVTMECFISDGLPDEKGDTKIICRPIEVPEERGSKLVEGGEELSSFSLGESRSFPIETLFGDKYEVVKDELWQKRLEAVHSKLPAFIELLNEQEVLKLTGLKARSPRTLGRVATLKAGAAMQQELIAVVRQRGYLGQTSLHEGPRLEQKHIFGEAMEMKMEVLHLKTPPRGEPGPLGIAISTIQRKHESKVAACSRGGVKGLYCFRVTGGALESFLRASGTYIFIFTLVSVKYVEVHELKFRTDITPSSKIGHWRICSHAGICSEHHSDRNLEVMKVRLGEVLPGALYLTRVDEFSNPMTFERVPTDVRCSIHTVQGDPVKVTIVRDLIKLSDDLLSLEIPRIEVGGGKLALLKKPTTQAALKISVDNNPVADFSIAVLPGPVAVARMKESYAISRLQPGQVLEHIVLEVLDSYQNPVSTDEEVKVILDGFDWQDKLGYQRSVDENGCLDLGMRLRITAGYGETARVELRTKEDLHLWDATFEVIYRKLRIRDDIPERVPAGSHLKDIIIEAVDEDGQVDIRMDGTAHILSLDWDSNIFVKLCQGRCTLPLIHIPHTPGELWKGCVIHTNNPELKILITVAITEERELNSDTLAVVKNETCEPITSSRTQAHTSEHDNININRKHHQLPVEVAPDIQAASDRLKKLQNKLKKRHQKVKKYDNDLIRLKRTKKEHEDALKQYQSELEVLSKEVKSKDEDSTTFDRTIMQMTQRVSELGNPPGSHAAALLLQAQRERFSGIKDVKGIVGIVALLGSVENEEVNRALVEFLGPEDMLAIVCDSKSAAESLGIPSATGARDKPVGLLEFVKSRNVKISGRYRVKTLTEKSSFYPTVDDVLPVGKAAIDDADPQKRLNISRMVSKPGSEGVVGSLGYAVNMVHLSEEQLKVRVLGYGLRETLFFGLFGCLEVFDTTTNMLRARKCIRTTAVSLDGGIIRKRNQYELGSREDPVVWFPGVGSCSKQAKGCSLPKHTTSVTAKRVAELKQRIQRERQSYAAGQTEADLIKTTLSLKHAKQKIADDVQLINTTNFAAISRNVAKVNESLPPGKSQWWNTQKKH